MKVCKVALAISTAILLSGCGGGSDDSPETNSNTGNDSGNVTQPEVEVELSTLSGCMDSLEAYSFDASTAANSRSHARLYQVTRLNHGEETKQQFKQSEIEVGDRVGLPNGLLPDTNVKVTQISIATEGVDANPWNPSFEHSYVNADSSQYIGTQDVFSRWWFTNIDSNKPNDLNIDEVTQYWVDRVDQFSPAEPIRHENLYATYKGKETIDTLLGERDVCVVEYSSELTLIDTTGDEPSEVLHIVESSTEYLDNDNIVQRIVKDYSEYDPADLGTVIGGYKGTVRS